MATEFQIPRNSLAWMLTAQIAVIAPHVPRLVPWILAVCVGCALWRIMIFQGRWSYPRRWAKVIFVLGGMIGVPAGYGRQIFGLEPAVALLIVAFVLKLLEMQHKRDTYIVIYLAYFVAVTEFLFFQTIPTFLYISAVIVMITASLIGLNQTQGHLSPPHTLKLSATLLAQSIPLMLALFVFFPRVGPLWTVPIQSQTARTGISGELSLGDVATLTRSADLAFRVSFEGDIPAQNKLYWRGVVLGDFDGQLWSQLQTGYGPRPVQWANNMDAPWDALIERRGDPVSYSVILEPTNQNWLFAMATPVPRTDGVGLVRDFRLYTLTPVQSRRRYEVTSYLEHRTEVVLSENWRRRLVQLPKGGNPLSRQLASELRARSATDDEYINRTMLMFAEGEYVYTLRPDPLGVEAIDDFLLRTRRGFCEHYASSFVFLMRAAGIPSRVVLGYQGGEFNPVGNYLAVRQFDAHAWAEVWLEGEGWRRVDPTSAVAPERIDGGLEAAIEDEDTFLEDSPLSWLRYSQMLWLTELRLQLDALGLYWDAWIVGYNPTVQFRFLGQFLGQYTRAQLGITLIGALTFILLIIAIFLLKPGKGVTVDRVTREYLKFCQIMERRGLARELGEGPLDYARRVGSANPGLRDAVNRITGLFVDMKYRDGDPRKLSELKASVRTLRMKNLTANI